MSHNIAQHDTKHDDMQNNTLALSLDLLSRASVTPEDGGCQKLIANRLQNIGFECQWFNFGEKNAIGKNAEVQNLWAKKGNRSPVFCFLGHTDVVPVGDPNRWRYPAFEPTQADGYLYARGAADMKTAIAAFVVASENFVKKYPNHQGSIAYLITSDEEGVAINGTVKVVEALKERGEHIDYCLVGEPSSTDSLGDVIKNGRRGSLNARLVVKGKQGHVAYPHLAVNPIHAASAAISELCATTWDNGNAYFPATSMQISNLNAGTGATNVICDELTALFNFRFSTEITADELMARTQAIFDKHLAGTQASYTIEWTLSGEPFLTTEGVLVNACKDAIFEVTGTQTRLSTSGGTSDGRFVAPMGADVVELGVINATIHQVDECVAVDDLGRLAQIYEAILHKVLVAGVS